MTVFESRTIEKAKKQAELSFGTDDAPKLEQRFAILLVQARAEECRHLATALTIKVGTPAALAFARELTERSHGLETVATNWAKQWPPAEDAGSPLDQPLVVM